MGFLDKMKTSCIRGKRTAEIHASNIGKLMPRFRVMRREIERLTMQVGDPVRASFRGTVQSMKIFLL